MYVNANCSVVVYTWRNIRIAFLDAHMSLLYLASIMCTAEMCQSLSAMHGFDKYFSSEVNTFYICLVI